MGIYIHCGEKYEYSCSYGYWDQVRMNTINATFKYIKSYIASTEITEYNKYNTDILLEFINKIESEPKLDINIFNNYCRQFNFIDSLIFFNISGIYAFCNKSDCDGYYSVGNSYDICQLFKLIKPFYIFDMKSIKLIEKVFKASLREGKIITIS